MNELTQLFQGFESLKLDSIDYVITKSWQLRGKYEMINEKNLLVISHPDMPMDIVHNGFITVIFLHTSFRNITDDIGD